MTADIEIDVGNCEYGELTGVDTVVYLLVDELQVKAAEGYKVIIGDENTTDPVPATSSPTDTTDPVVATTSH